MELSVGGRPKRVTVMGLGLFGGGVGAARFWAGLGSTVTVTDLRDATVLAPSLQALEGTSCHFVLGEHRVEDFIDTDLVIVNPAVKPGNPYVEAAREAGVTIDSEIGTLLQLLRGTVYGVTGSNGKSTTTAMLGSIMTRFSPHALVGGNLGGSLLEEAQRRSPTTPVILELSSFQLHYLNEQPRSPQVAVVTNLSPNHLDWHGCEEAYYEAKRTILRYQWPEDLAVLPAGDARIERWAEKVRCRIVWVGHEDPDTPNAAFYRGDALVVRWAGRERASISDRCIQVPGAHNRLNAAMAAAAAIGTGVGEEFVAAGLEAFQGLPHRLERVAEKDGITYINDSISTT
ncbi:MAG: UDP-N-acetylmuramoyl-L-alanine--D-glutamate ligase, partial [Planctomycetota bacterium]